MAGLFSFFPRRVDRPVESNGFSGQISDEFKVESEVELTQVVILNRIGEGRLAQVDFRVLT